MDVEEAGHLIAYSHRQPRAFSEKLRVSRPLPPPPKVDGKFSLLHRPTHTSMTASVMRPTPLFPKWTARLVYFDAPLTLLPRMNNEVSLLFHGPSPLFLEWMMRLSYSDAPLTPLPRMDGEASLLRRPTHTRKMRVSRPLPPLPKWMTRLVHFEAPLIPRLPAGA